MIVLLHGVPGFDGKTMPHKIERFAAEIDVSVFSFEGLDTKAKPGEIPPMPIAHDLKFKFSFSDADGDHFHRI